MSEDGRIPAADAASIPGETEAAGGSLWAIGSWLSAALDDPNVCAEMKRDIREWFDGGGSVKGDAPVPLAGWQDISSAPKSTYRALEFGNLVDAVYLMGFCPEEGADPDGCIEVVWWEPLDKGGKGCWTNGHFDCRPTHWMHLPATPDTVK